MADTLEIADIQGFVLSGYAHLDDAVYLFLQVQNAAKARAWLTQITPEVSSAARWPVGADGKKIKPQTQLNIAFTHPGLAALELPKTMLESFSTEFKEGITGVERSFILGDTEQSAPETWELGGPNNPAVHMLLMLFAATPESLAALRDRFRATFGDGGLTEIAAQESHRFLNGFEHFGFRDGVSQPAVQGEDQTVLPGQDVIKPGEFILGYQNEYDLQPPTPEPPTLGKNGSYLVYRKLAQDVGAFRQFVSDAAQGDLARMAYLSAKIVGRWPSGAPLTLAPEQDDPTLGADPQRNNAFKFAATDPYGYAMPLGAHIRRANPRDVLEGSASDSLATTKRHRLLRRGRSYGSPYSAETANAPRGTLFVTINADIKRQFEFVQQTWVSDPKFAALYNDRDPLIGSSNGDTELTIQRQLLRQKIMNIPRFVVVKAGGYFFMPGIKALAMIAGKPS